MTSAEQAFSNISTQGGKVMNISINLNNPLKADICKTYGGKAQVIYDAGCENFGWDKAQRYLFGPQRILYAKEVTPENYSVWFLSHNNFTKTINGNWYNKIDAQKGIIEEMWSEHQVGELNVYKDYTKRITFAKTKNGYVFLGVYQADTVENVLCREPIIVKGKVFKQDFETVWMKTYKLISDTYPISTKTIENDVQVKPTKNKFGALGGFTKN